MIPILYRKEEEQAENPFKSNGLGRLSDAFSCIVTEERNGIYELEMEYPITGIHFKEIENDCYIKAVPFSNGTPQLFRIYSITKPINGRVSIYANHISYQLLFIPCLPFTAKGARNVLAMLKENATEECPFDFWTDNDSTRQYTLEYPDTIRRKLQGDQWSILQNYGGEYEFDNYTVKLWKDRGRDKGVTIRYGKNLLDFKQEENIQNTYTAIVPYWYGLVGNQQEVMYLPEVTLYSVNVDLFPYKRTVTVDFTEEFADKPTEDQLRSRGYEYIRKNEIGTPRVSIKLSFVELSKTEEYKNLPFESINLCDYITVSFPELGVSTKEKITKTVWNVLLDRYDELQIGGSYSSLAVSIERAEQETAITEGRITNLYLHAMEQMQHVLNGDITGASVITETDHLGNPVGTIYMDTMDPDTARNCIRIDSRGIAFSSEGIDGPWNSAWSIDSSFDARYITAGTLNADLIRAGILKSVNGDSFYLDLETGELIINAGSGQVAGSDIETENTTAGVRSDVSDVLQHFHIREDAGLEIVTDDGTSIILSNGNATIKIQDGNATNINGENINAGSQTLRDFLQIGNHKLIARSDGYTTDLVYTGV